MLENKKAVIFDLDGTLVDSMWIWREIDIRFLGKYGLQVPEGLNDELEGYSFHETAVYFKKRFELPLTIEEIMETWNHMASEIYVNEIPLKDGVQDFISLLKERDMKLAIATSNSRKLAKDCLRANGILDAFDYICTSDEVPRGKPEPDVYLHALNKTTASGKKNEQKIKLTGVYDSGDEDNGSLYIASSTAQVLADLPDSVDKIEVKALTTPENDLARKAAANPAALSQEEWETWYCTAYPSSIAYQIEEVLPGAVAKQVRQVAALQGNVLQKTQAVMILMTVLSLIAAAVAVANLMVASIGERSGELALLKALGATDAAVSRLMLAETAAISLLGAIVGALLGSGVAQLIGRVVFGSGITMRPMVFVLVFVLLAVTVLLASASSIRSILNLKPAEVLHGR